MGSVPVGRCYRLCALRFAPPRFATLHIATPRFALYGPLYICHFAAQRRNLYPFAGRLWLCHPTLCRLHALRSTGPSTFVISQRSVEICTPSAGPPARGSTSCGLSRGFHPPCAPSRNGQELLAFTCHCPVKLTALHLRYHRTAKASINLTANSASMASNAGEWKTTTNSSSNAGSNRKAAVTRWVSYCRR